MGTTMRETMKSQLDPDLAPRALAQAQAQALNPTPTVAATLVPNLALAVMNLLRLNLDPALLHRSLTLVLLHRSPVPGHPAQAPALAQARSLAAMRLMRELMMVVTATTMALMMVETTTRVETTSCRLRIG